MSEQSMATLEALGDAGGAIAAVGGGLLFFGVFLLVSAGILVAGAVFLFQGVRPKFVLAAAGIAILVEVIGLALTGFGLSNTIGIVGGILAILAGRQIAAELEPPAPATAGPGADAAIGKKPFDATDRLLMGSVAFGLLLVAGAAALQLSRGPEPADIYGPVHAKPASVQPVPRQRVAAGDGYQEFLASKAVAFEEGGTVYAGPVALRLDQFWSRDEPSVWVMIRVPPPPGGNDALDNLITVRIAEGFLEETYPFVLAK